MIKWKQLGVIMKKMNVLVEFIKQNPSVSYNEELKKEFARKGRAALKEFSNLFPGNPVEIYYNKAGIASSGDFHFKVMNNPSQGVELFFNLDPFGSYVTFRTITSFTDYTGGQNNNAGFDLLAQPDVLKSKLMAIL